MITIASRFALTLALAPLLLPLATGALGSEGTHAPSVLGSDQPHEPLFLGSGDANASRAPWTGDANASPAAPEAARRQDPPPEGPPFARAVDGLALPGPGRWSSRGGSPSHSGVACGPGPRGPLHEAWSVELGGRIESEPLVWDERLLVSLAIADDRHELVSLSLLDGSELARAQVAGRVALEPSLWGSTVAFVSERGLELYRWSGASLRRIRTKKLGERVLPPILSGDDLYVAGDFGLQRRSARSNRVLWEVAGDYHGGLALVDERVYALRADAGWVQVIGHDANDGRERERFRLCRMTADADALRLIALKKYLWIGGGAPLVLAGFAGAPTGASALLPRPLNGSQLPGYSTQLLSPPASHGAGWMAYMNSEAGPALLSTTDGQRVMALARASDGPVLFGEPDRQPTIVGDVVTTGTVDFELASHRVFEKRERAPRLRPVPARESLLVVDGPGRLVALRERRSEPTAWVSPGPSERPASGVWLTDGRLLVDEWQLDIDERQVRGASRRTRNELWPLERVRAVIGAGGALAWARDRRELAATLTELAERQRAEDYVEVAYDARKCCDADLIERLLQTAVDGGSVDEKLDKVDEALAELVERPRDAKEKPVRRALDAEAELPSRLERIRVLSGGLLEAEDAPRRAAWRALLGADASDVDTVTAVRAALPAGLVPRGTFDALDWLDFLEANARTPVRVVAPAADESSADDDQRFLGRALAMNWRDDLTALRSENLLVITPVQRPGALARCLLLGELVSSALEEIFAAGTERRDERYPLRLFLYESKEEYLQQSPAGRGESGSGLAWTAGHYSPVENVSRIYIPEGEQAIEDVMRTYAHELTHHWLQVKCPLVSTEEGTLRNRPPMAYWIVEGFASLIEEFRFDLASGAWDSFDARSDRLDLVAHAGKLLPWDALYEVGQAAMLRLDPNQEQLVRTSWRLGYGRRIGPIQLFYAQAASTCQFLYHAEDGRYREALTRYVGDYYAGRVDGLDVEAAFGLSADELGRRVERYARGVALGERP